MKIFILMIVVALGHMLGHLNYVKEFSKKPRTIKRLDKAVSQKHEQYLSVKIVSENLEGVSKLLKRNLAATDRDSLVVKEQVYLLNQITELMEVANLNMIKIDPKPLQTERGFRRKPYLIHFEGTYKKTLNFISSIEKMDRMISIERLDISDNTSFAQKISSLQELPRLELHVVKMTINALTIIKRG